MPPIAFKLAEENKKKRGPYKVRPKSERRLDGRTYRHRGYDHDKYMA